MKIKNIKLRGFIGIQKGLGLDEITIDVSGLSGLIALEGANGIGKTTLLENLQPFRVLPSRTGTLKSNCYLKDSVKDLTFEFNGETYRTIIKIDATTTRPDEGFIYKNGATESEVDGKVTNYDDYIEKLLGSPTLFFSSIFCAQNSRKLSDLRPAELKALFAEFLRLDRYIAWEETAKANMRICHGAIDNLADTDTKTETKIKMLGDPRADLKGAVTKHSYAEKNLESLDLSINEESVAVEKLKKEVIEAEHNNQRIKDHEKIIEQLTTSQIDTDAKYQRANVSRLMGLEGLESDLAKQKVILDNKNKIENAVADRLKVEKELAILNNDRTNVVIVAQQHIDEKNLVSAKVQEFNKRLHETANAPHLIDLAEATRAKYQEVEGIKALIKNMEKSQDIVRAQARVEALQKSAGVLDDIDPACTSEVCGLITLSLQARDDLPRAEKNLDALRYSTKKDLHDRLTRAEAEHAASSTLLSEHETALAGVVATLNTELAKAAAEIEVIDEQYNALAKENEEITASIDMFKKKLLTIIPVADRLPELVAADNLSHAHKKHIAELQDLIIKSDESYAQAKAETLNQIKNAEVIIKGIREKINPEAEKHLTETKARLVLLANDRRREEEDRLRYAVMIPKAKREVEELAALEAERVKLNQRAEWVNGQMAEWDYCRLACSKDGMRALEIEAVAPVITKNANDLLNMTFGPNHSVKFDTQDEDGKEVLSIIVIAGDGSETPLHILSGGEKVWILKSLRLAQTLISQEKSGRHFETALMDEEDGALSSDNAISFIKLYRSFQTMAKMSLCFYITHRPEAIAMADNIIRFTPGRVRII